MIRSGVVIKNGQRWLLSPLPDSCWYAAGQFYEMNHAGMLIMQKSGLNVNTNCIVRPEAVGCENDAPTSFGMAHSRDVFGPPDAGLYLLKLLR